MKKSVIAAAVAAVLAVPVVAMADVSISGGLQAELRNVGGDGNSLAKGLYASDGGQYASQNGGSWGFLKFSASEDLGNGLKALAMWDGNVNIGATNGGTSAGGMSGRDAYVGLAGGWGAVLAGTLSTPYKSSTVGWDPFVTTSLQARGNGGMSMLQNGYASNALAYAGNFNGVKVVAAMVLDEAANGTSTSGNNSVSFSVNAPIGPVELAVAYINLSKNAAIITNLDSSVPVATARTVDNLDSTKVGLKWNSGAITIAGQVEMLGKGWSTDGSSHNMEYIVGSYAMGNNTVSVAYGTADKHLSGFALGFNGLAAELAAHPASGTAVPTNDPSKNVTYMMVGLNHAFSKTTSTFVGYQATDAGSGTKQNTVSVGLRVGF